MIYSKNGLDTITNLGKHETGVRIFDDGGHAIWIDGQEGGLFELRGSVDVGFVRDAELFEEDGDLPWVGLGLVDQ